jgi:hypothetical protein
MLSTTDGVRSTIFAGNQTRNSNVSNPAPPGRFFATKTATSRQQTTESWVTGALIPRQTRSFAALVAIAKAKIPDKLVKVTKSATMGFASAQIMASFVMDYA